MDGRKEGRMNATTELTTKQNETLDPLVELVCQLESSHQKVHPRASPNPWLGVNPYLETLLVVT